MPNIIDCTSDAIELLNLDQVKAGSARIVRIRIGCAIFHLAERDIRDVKSRLAKQSSPPCALALGKCRLKLTAEGRELLLTLIEQVINARAAYEQRQQEEEQARLERQRIEDEWRGILRTR